MAKIVKQFVYNPYDPIILDFKGKQMQGRPFILDSDIADYKTMRNKSGKLVKPKTVSTICPECGQGLEVEVDLDDYEPPFDVIEAMCKVCHDSPPPMANPFQNPIDSGRVAITSLDPVGFDPYKPIADDGLTVAERMGDKLGLPTSAQDNISEVSPEPSEAVVANTVSDTVEVPDPSEEAQEKPSEPLEDNVKADMVSPPPVLSKPVPVIPPAEGMGDWDDELAEDI